MFHFNHSAWRIQTVGLFVYLFHQRVFVKRFTEEYIIFAWLFPYFCFDLFLFIFIYLPNKPPPLLPLSPPNLFANTPNSHFRSASLGVWHGRIFYDFINYWINPQTHANSGQPPFMFRPVLIQNKILEKLN